MVNKMINPLANDTKLWTLNSKLIRIEKNLRVQNSFVRLSTFNECCLHIIQTS